MFLNPKHLGIDTKFIKFELIVIELWSLRVSAAILDAILKKIHFRGLDFPRLLVCYKVH